MTMAGGAGSVVVRRGLGRKLRALRVAAGKTIADVIQTGVASEAKMWRIETGKGPVKAVDVREFCRIYGADAATTEALAAMASGTQSAGWWEADIVPDWFSLYAGLEALATRIRGFELELVNGLMQTPAYAVEVISAYDPRLRQEVLEQRVRFRMERQRTVLETEPVPDVRVVMSESALRVGSPEVLSEQIAHLYELSERPHLDIRVLPFDAGQFPRRGSFMLLDFDSDEDPPVAYAEAPMGARYFERPEERSVYEFAFDTVYEKSVAWGEWRR